MSRPRAIVVAGPGTNRDTAAARALDLAGANAEIVLSARLVAEPQLLDDARILVIAGGFSYADALGAGRMLALELTHGGTGRLGQALRSFVAGGRPVLGICNGFQVLTRAGLLPGALGHNEQGRFECRWVELSAPPSRSIWTAGLQGDGSDGQQVGGPATIHCPVAHGEGRYVHPDPVRLAADGLVALRYASGNPNGSVADIAGVCDSSGVVLGLMPHPEDHAVPRQHPRHHRGGGGDAHLGLRLFESGVRHAKEL
jgi:phosphoribosylformylglycinamidine synthase